MSLLFASGGQCTGASASTSVLPMNFQGWFPLGLTGLILLSQGLSRVFSSTTVRISSLKWRKGWMTWMTSQAILKSFCPCSRDSMDGGAWVAAVHGVAQSRTQLKRLSSSSRDSRKSSNSSHIWKTTWKDSDEEVLERHSSRQFYVCWAPSVCWVLKPPAWRKVWCEQRTDKTHA